MKSSTWARLRRVFRYVVLASIALAAFPAGSQTTPAPAPAWNFTKYFRYNIENVLVHVAGARTWEVKVIFSVTNPNPDGSFANTTWDIQADPPFRSAGASLSLLIGWDSTEFSDTGSTGAASTPVVTTSLGTGAALPVQVRNLTQPGPTPPQVAKRCTAAECPGVGNLTNRFWVSRLVTPVAFARDVTTGRIGIEGKPVCNGPGCPTTAAPFANIPVTSATADFSFLDVASPTSAMIASPRRKIVDLGAKCRSCHNGTTLSDGEPIPRLSLHGNNRNENLDLCVMCHNANQTDVPYRTVTTDPRTSGPEASVDFKSMVHSIHAGEFRKSPFVVIGFNTSVHDYSRVRFPKPLRNCLNCHVTDAAGRGSYELPLHSSALGSTIITGSVYAVAPGTARTIDVDPFNDIKITPTAATCSGCHGSRETRSHMTRTGGASFATNQRDIGSTVKERCVDCHGRGKKKDVRRVHEVRAGD